MPDLGFKTIFSLKEPKLVCPKSFGETTAAITPLITKIDKERKMSKETGAPNGQS